MAEAAHRPYAPLNTLKPVARELWVVDGPEIAFGYLGLKLPFPTRMSVIRLPDGRLWLHSPTEPDEALVASVAALGEVAFLIAPNTLHYWWLPDWRARFPAAAVFAVAGLAKSARRPLGAFQALASEAPPAWSG